MVWAAFHLATVHTHIHTHKHTPIHTSNSPTHTPTHHPANPSHLPTGNAHCTLCQPSTPPYWLDPLLAAHAASTQPPPPACSNPQPAHSLHPPPRAARSLHPRPRDIIFLAALADSQGVEGLGGRGWPIFYAAPLKNAHRHCSVEMVPNTLFEKGVEMKRGQYRTFARVFQAKKTTDLRQCAFATQPLDLCA